MSYGVIAVGKQQSEYVQLKQLHKMMRGRQRAILRKHEENMKDETYRKVFEGYKRFRRRKNDGNV